MADKKPPTKTQILASLAESTGLTKKDVQAVLDSLSDLIAENIAKKGPGAFTIPGLIKITRKHVPAKPAQKNVYFPMLKEHRDVPAKPATTKVRVTALKKLKDMV